MKQTRLYKVSFYTTSILIVAIVLGCKSTQKSSEISTINKEDTARLLQGTEQFDKSTLKAVVAIYSEDILSNGGDTLWSALNSTVNTNLGKGYSKYLISNVAKKAYGASEIFSHTEAHSHSEIIKSLQKVIQELESKITKETKRIEIIFHLFAHGRTTTGKGDGYFEVVTKGLSNINNEEIESKITWSELWEKIILPLNNIGKSRNLKPEILAFMEPCYSGNIIPHIPKYAQNLDLMLITGESSMAPQHGFGQHENSFMSALSHGVNLALKGYANNLDTIDQPFHLKFTSKEIEEYGIEKLGELKDIDDITLKEFEKYIDISSKLTTCIQKQEHRVNNLVNPMGVVCSTFKSIQDSTKKLPKNLLSDIFKNFTGLDPEKDLNSLLGNNLTEAEQTFLYGEFFGVSNIQIYKAGSFITNENKILSLSSPQIIKEARQNMNVNFINNTEKEMFLCKHKEDISFDHFRTLLKIIHKRIHQNSLSRTDSNIAEDLCFKHENSTKSQNNEEDELPEGFEIIIDGDL